VNANGNAGPGAAFRLRGIAVRFGASAALDGVDLEVGAGESLALVGPSGAGKTTLLRLLNGTQIPDGGTVEVNGEPLASLARGPLRRLRSRIGFVHQDLSLVPSLRVSQNVLSGRLGSLSFAGAFRTILFPGSADLARAHALLDRVGIPDKLFERCDRLSGGQRQRVAIARALMQEPVALLADEPVSSVDPARARDTVALLTEISRERGITLVMSLHNLALAREFFPRLVGLRGGRVLFDRPTAAVGDAEFDMLYDLARAELLE